MKSSANSKRRPTAMTPEEHEDHMIGLAMDLAERKLMDGTASNQLIIHYLDLATEKHKREVEKLSHENELLKAKTETLQSMQRVEILYRDALNAMRDYSGSIQQDDEQEDY